MQILKEYLSTLVLQQDFDIALIVQPESVISYPADVKHTLFVQTTLFKDTQMGTAFVTPRLEISNTRFCILYVRMNQVEKAHLAPL